MGKWGKGKNKNVLRLLWGYVIISSKQIFFWRKASLQSHSILFSENPCFHTIFNTTGFSEKDADGAKRARRVVISSYLL
jgi:hypothetical protein